MSLKDDNDARRARLGISGDRRYGGSSRGGDDFDWGQFFTGRRGGQFNLRDAPRVLDTVGDTLQEGDRLRGRAGAAWDGQYGRTEYERARGRAERAEGSADRAEIRRREGARTLRDERDYDRGYADGSRGDRGYDDGRRYDDRDDRRGGYDVRVDRGSRDDRDDRGGYDGRDDRDYARPAGRYTDPGRARIGGAGSREPEYDVSDSRGGRDNLALAIMEFTDVMEARAPSDRDTQIDQYYDRLATLQGRDGLIHIDRAITVTIEGGQRVTIPAKPEGYRMEEITREIARDLRADPALEAPLSIRLAARDTEDRTRDENGAGDRDRGDRGERGRDGGDRDTGRSSAPELPNYALDSGTGDIKLSDDAYKNASRPDRIKMLVNSRTVTGLDGQPVSSGDRLNGVMHLMTEEAKGMPAGAVGMTQFATLGNAFNDPAFARNLEQLYRDSTDAERASIRARMAELGTEVKRIDPNLEAPFRQAMDKLTAADRETGGRDGTDRGTGSRDGAPDVDQAARLEALGRVHFSDPEKEALWQTKLQQERAMQSSGGPFGAFFMQLFTMIGNVLSGKGELNQSAEQFITANQATLTPESKPLADDILANRIPPATGAAPGGPAATPGEPADGPPPPPPPPGAAPSVLNVNTISTEVTANEARLAREQGRTNPQTYEQISQAPIVTLTPTQYDEMKSRLAGMGFDVGPVTGASDLTKVETSIKQLETMIGRTGAAVDGKIDAQLIAIMRDPEAMAAVKAARDAGAAAAPGGAGGPPPTPAGAATGPTTGTGR